MEKRKSKKEQKQDDPVVRVENIGSPQQLYLAKIDDNVAIKLLDCFTTPISLPIQQHKYHLIALIRALKNNTKVPKLIFTPYSWKQDELHLLEESLAHNQGITEIEFDGFGFSAMFTEIIVRILKYNKSIKRVFFNTSQIALDSWARFCDGLEYYSFDDLEIRSMGLTEKHMAAFCEGIPFNQTIRSVKFENELFPGKSLELLCKTLETHITIERLQFVHSLNNETDYGEFNRVFNGNILKSLALQKSNGTPENLRRIQLALQNNTSITELYVAVDYASTSALGDILTANKTIKKLDLGNYEYFSIDDENFSEVKLKDNKTITDLSLAGCRVTLPKIIQEFEHNSTLKVLKIGDNKIQQPALLENFLKTTTLREFYIQNTLYSSIYDVAIALTEALKVNKTLRKFEVNFEHLSSGWLLERFFEALKYNTALTHLKIVNLNSRRSYNNCVFTTESDMIEDLLKTNKTLRYINGADNFAALKKNREAQDKIINNMCILIKMILMKPSSFILPIEVWSNIFKHASYSFVPFDFEEYFSYGRLYY